MRSRRALWDLLSKGFRPFQSRPFCTSNKIEKPIGTGKNNSTNGRKDVDGDESAALNRLDAYKELDNLNFMTAARILFSDPPKKRKFGLDFHLVQLFFACLPSVAVYLVAQYARSEMRRMEAELEVRKKAEKEAKAEEMKRKALEEPEEISDPQLLAVKMRLEKLEETVKEIADESKKRSNDARVNNAQGDKIQGTKVESNSTITATSGDKQAKVSKGTESSASVTVTETSQQNQKSTQKQARGE